LLGAKDPQAQSLVPSGLGQQTLTSLDSIVSSLQAALNEASNARRLLRSRILGGSDLDVTDPASVRSSINALVQLVMTGAVAGSPQVNLQGVNIQVAILRQSIAAVGADTGVQYLDLPSVNNSGAGTRFVFPPQVLQDAVAGQANLTDEISLVAVRFLINVDELLHKGVDNRTADHSAPASNITEFVALNFQLTDSNFLHPQNLSLPIQIIQPLLYSDIPSANSNKTLACGYWNVNLPGWSSAGCNVTNVTLPLSPSDLSGTLTCSCNHASDYAAWQAFEEDVQSVFNPVDLTVLTTISLILVVILLPGCVIIWVLLLTWGRRRDRKDADRIHVASFVLLTANKIRMHQRQRRFLQALRSGVKVNKNSGLPVDYFRPKLEATKRRHWLWIFIRGIYYESSFFGLANRFDPYFERMQRVSIVLGIVVGNLFIACFFYQLQTASDVSTGFLIGRIILGSIVVIIPVKLCVRVLFIITVAREGSKMDRVVHIFRVLAFQNDISPSGGSEAERADVDLLYSLKRYYLAKKNVQALRDTKSALETSKKSVVQRPISVMRKSLPRFNPIFDSLKSELPKVESQQLAARDKDDLDLDEQLELAEHDLIDAQKALSASIRQSQVISFPLFFSSPLY